MMFCSRRSFASLALLLVFLLCCEVALSRRGGGFRFRSSGRRTYRHSAPKKSYRSRGHFGKGGMETYGKVVLATYLTKKMTPSVNFHAHHMYGAYYWPTFCQKCLSINGSDLACEKGLGEMEKCFPTNHRPYCSTEYGLTGDDLRYVRRACNERRCNTCSHHILKATNATTKCHTIQCDMCNWEGCNDKSVTETFHDKWTGCTVDAKDHRRIFAADDTCAGCSIAQNILLTTVTGVVAQLVVKL